MTTHTKKAKFAKPVAAPGKKKSKLSFFTDSVEELRKARWPTRQETLRLSIMVLVVCLIAGAILGILDYGFTKMFGRLLLSG